MKTKPRSSTRRQDKTKAPAKSKSGRRSRRLTGLAIAPGIAIGPAYLVDESAAPVPEYSIKAKQISGECRRFTACVSRSQRQIAGLAKKAATLPSDMRDEVVNLLDTHRQMLRNSRLVRGVKTRITDDQINAEAAVAMEVSELVERFHAMDDAYLAARGQEIRELGNRLLRNLAASAHPLELGVPAGSIVVTPELTPADTALIDPAAVAGIVTHAGGVEGHTAIMARALELPTVLGVEDLDAISADAVIIVDGDKGEVLVDPTAKQIAAAQARQRAQLQDRRRLAKISGLPATTLDAQVIALHANLEMPREIAVAKANGAQGVGLLRTEFMYLNRTDLPGEDEQFKQLARFVRAMGKAPVTIRTLDIGGDKMALGLSDALEPGPNPALGLRALRLSLRNPEILETQLAAILRAGALGTVRILLPMATNRAEVVTVREHISRIARRLARKNVSFADPLPPVGVMIEVPGAALAADALAEVSDFFAIGTNDLTMYTLAIDRSDEHVAHLYNPLHPAVLKLIDLATEAALRARIPVSVCGEIAGDPDIVPLLLGLGVRELSMTANALPRVKDRIRHLDMADAKRLTEMVMTQGDPDRIGGLLKDFAAST
ncbi:MAG: phosphoenolpyruvate--protein phosphotransferase [Alphaproteobacteria bacterium]|nr:phosphoenolpyruvate--protein phosphotransferase [Alphaproteobacteria bacterium]